MAGQRTASNPEACRRCGTCCQKGGPALHEQDRDLVEKGRIPLKDLYTIRSGEWVRDNVCGTLQRLDAEIIKVKARKPDERVCRFFDEPGSSCRIYTHRPIECRTLQCWDTVRLERMYTTGRLGRKDLLGNLEGLWDLVQEHDRRCRYDVIDRLARRLKTDGRQTDADELGEILLYDAELRKLVVEKTGLDEQMLDFLLGRPLAQTLRQFGIRLERGKERPIRVIVPRVASAGKETDSTENDR